MPILKTYTKAHYDKYYASGAWKEETFTSCLAEAVKKHPKKIALVQGDRRVSYAELDELVRRFAAALYEMGIRPEEIVSVQLPNSIELAVVILALVRIGAVYNPLNPGYRKHEVDQIVGLLRPRAVICPREYKGFAYTELHDQVAYQVDSVEFRICVGEPPTPQWVSFEQVLAAGAKALDQHKFPPEIPDPDNVLLLGTTSGTTGNPKIYIHTAQTQLQEAKGVNRLLGVAGDAVFLAMAPMTHRGALMFGFFTSIATGATLVLADAYDPVKVLGLFEKEKITHFMAIPTQVIDLLALYEKERRDVSSLRLAVMSGAPVGEALVERFAKAWPHCVPVTGYGMSEVGYCTLTRPEDPKEKLYTSGKPALGMEIEIRDEEGRPLPVGKTGEIHIRGPLVCAGYYANQKATDEAIDRNGWLASGDLGFLDGEGYLHPVGRLKHVIIRGGLKIRAEEIEFILSQHPAVAAAVVISVPDERLGEKVCACVMTRGGDLSLEQIKEFFEEKGVAKFQWPELIKVFEDFPRNPVGKIDRHAIKEAAAKG